MSSRVYLLMRHHISPFSDGFDTTVGQVVAAYSNRAEPQQIADKKNAGKPRYSMWTVKAKQVKA